MAANQGSIERYKHISKSARTVLNIIFIIYAIVCIFPLLLVLAVSFTSESSLTTYGYNIFPKQFSLLAYQYVFGNGGEVVRAYFNTIIATTVGTALSIIMTAGLAYPLSRKDFRYRNKFTFYVVFTMLFNGGIVPLYIVYSQLIPIKNTLLALIIPNMLSGFNVILMKTYFSQNIPDSIVEAAEIDGASIMTIFFKIILPLSKPVLATVGLFTGMSYWNDYFRCMLFVSNDNEMSLQYLLYRIQTEIQVMNTNPQLATHLGAAIPSDTARMAMVIISIGPIIFLYPFLQKYFVKGLTIGAVKG